MLSSTHAVLLRPSVQWYHRFPFVSIYSKNCPGICNHLNDSRYLLQIHDPPNPTMNVIHLLFRSNFLSQTNHTHALLIREIETKLQPKGSRPVARERKMLLLGQGVEKKIVPGKTHKQNTTHSPYGLSLARPPNLHRYTCLLLYHSLSCARTSWNSMIGRGDCSKRKKRTNKL